MASEYSKTYIVQHPAGVFRGIVLYDNGQDPLVHARDAWGSAATFTPSNGPVVAQMPTIVLDIRRVL